MKPQTLKYIYVGETKNRFRYDQEAVDGVKLAVVGSLYVDKVEATDVPPKELIVTVTPVAV